MHEPKHTNTFVYIRRHICTSHKTINTDIKFRILISLCLCVYMCVSVRPSVKTAIQAASPFPVKYFTVKKITLVKYVNKYIVSLLGNT